MILLQSFATDASKKRERFGVSSYSHSLPKRMSSSRLQKIVFKVVFEQVRTAVLLALMSFF